jgi:hypothetical protein
MGHKNTTAKSNKSQKYGAALSEQTAFIRGNSRNSRTKNHGLGSQKYNRKDTIIGNLKFLAQPDKLKQGGTNEIQENYVGRKRGNFSAAL